MLAIYTRNDNKDELDKFFDKVNNNEQYSIRTTSYTYGDIKKALE